MNKNPITVLAAALLLGLLAACSSTPDPEQAAAAVEERTPGSTANYTTYISRSTTRSARPDATRRWTRS